ncbi:MAG: PKD domain-containing protein, partial [Vicinamibacterales bacterium]
TQQTIWDGGGDNVLALSEAGASATGYRVDTRSLGWVTTGGNYQGAYVVAGTNVGPGVRIHELITSPSDDTVYLNPDVNVVRGYAPGQVSGADVIIGASEADTLDLSAYTESDVIQTASGPDLVIELGASGRITLRDYYAGSRIAVSFANGSGTGSGNSGPATNLPPTAVASASPNSGVAPLTVAFSAGGSSDVDGRIVSYAWTIAPGVTAGSASAQHTFTSPGSYVVALTVTDDDGATANATTTVVVTAPPSPAATGKNRTPVAVFAADPTSGSAPLAVRFSGQSSSDPDGTIVSYDWAFGNGATASGSSASFTYTTPGTYLATLAVTDNRGARHTQAAWITVTAATSAPNRPPVAVATATPPSGVAPLPVTFSAAGSSDPDGSVTGYSWAFGDGATGTGATVSHTYAVAGSYVATLTVSDNRGATASAATSVTVTATSTNRPPVAVVVAAPLTGRAPLNVSFSAAGSSDPDGTVASYAWSFGDGDSAAGVAVSHTYVAAGTYAATLTVTDAQGATHSSSTPIVVSAAPSATATTMSVGSIGLQILNDGGRWVGDVVVTIVDNEGRPVPQAVVSGRWTGMVPSSFLYAMTDGTGRASFRSKSLNTSGTVGFTVMNVARNDLTYSAVSNAVTSSSIVFTKP